MTIMMKARVLFIAIAAIVAALWLHHSVTRLNEVATAPKKAQPSQEQWRAPSAQKLGQSGVSFTTDQPKDAFAFVARSASKALGGDGKAAYQIAAALGKCLPIKAVYGSEPDPQAAFSKEWANRVVPEWVVNRARAALADCTGFLNGDAFSGLPDRPGGYQSIKFWNDLAYQEKNPVAMVAHAAATAQTVLINARGNEDQSGIDSMQTDINAAALSGDPEALYRIGQLLADGRIGVDALEGPAVMIAACNLGYDCSSSNERVFGACVAAGTCQQGETYEDVIGNGIGANRYAQAYEKAQELQTAIEQQSTSTIQTFVQLRAKTVN